ncbi:ArgS-related anticodon-binding protein NrtL [Streptomyces sp. NPDC050658]|uniref:ArgS-related anticodon-binding protein NrtL n=1 Tax=unclassified Streptomyces TaxID=2593676 RepID=UPI00343B2614
MTPVELSRTVLRAMRRAVDDGELRDVGMIGAGKVVVERPRPGGRGDYATNVALQVAKAAGRSPLQVAEILSPRIAREPGIAGIDITGPGFLNITLAESSDHGAALVRDVLDRGARYGHVHPGPGSGSGPGPGTNTQYLHFPREPRAAVLADALRRILHSQGCPVRSTCSDAPDPAWGALGVHIDEIDRIGEADGIDRIDGDEHASHRAITLRPVPAPHDPTPLGRDAARWALLYPAGHDQPRIEASETLAQRESNPRIEAGHHLAQRESNPLFRVRYAHSRSRALLRNAAALGFSSEPGATTEAVDAAPEAVPAAALEAALLDRLAEYPRVLATAARRHAPDRLARHLVDTADAFLAFQPTVLPRGDEKPLAAHRARLALAEAAGTVLAGGLSLLGISAPEYL